MATINEIDVLSYVVATFEYWGIKYVNEHILKNSRKNQQTSIYPMKKLLFHLSFLHMFNFEVKINDYFNPQQHIKPRELDEINLAYLSECQCPLLLTLQDTDENIEYSSCNFQSSRNLLLICGWVMATSNYFNQIFPKAILKRLQTIQNPSKKLPKYLQTLFENSSKTGQIAQSSNSIKVMQLYKSIQSREYNVECLQKKTFKIKQRISNQLQKMYPKLKFEDFFMAKETQEEASKQNQLKKILINQNQHMSQRKHFWIWLDEKILSTAQKQLLKTNENYQKLQCNIKSSQFQIDFSYQEQYEEVCAYYEAKYRELREKFESLNLDYKKSKAIVKQVQDQCRQTLQTMTNKKSKKYLFIASQLKQYLNIQPKPTRPTEKIPTRQPNHQTIVLKKRLKQQLRQFLQSISQSVQFIDSGRLKVQRK